MVDDRYSGGLLQTMPNLLIATPDYLLRYDTDLREVFVIEVGRPEYYGISWFPGDDTIFLSHSGLDNNLLQDAMDYANSEVGWISRASENSWPFVSQPHQILCLDDGSLAVTNTGRNCLTIANPADWSIRHHRYGGALWDRLGASDRSGNHFNSLAARNEFLYVVAHNFEKGSYILKLERPSLRLVELLPSQTSGIHNLWLRDDGLLIACDTMRRRLISLGDEKILWRSPESAGLTRGLAATADRIYVGSSNHALRSDRRDGETGIWIVDAGRFTTLDYYDVGYFAVCMTSDCSMSWICVTRKGHWQSLAI
jgi:hypothetical protein